MLLQFWNREKGRAYYKNENAKCFLRGKKAIVETVEQN